MVWSFQDPDRAEKISANSGKLPSTLQAFVPAPRAESPSLRGLAAAAGIAATPGVASAADEYLNYNMTGGHNQSF